MGTSISNAGPTGSSPLLPPWAPPLEPTPNAPGDGDGAPPDAPGESDSGQDGSPLPGFQPPPGWDRVKRQTTRLASGGSTGRAARTRARAVARNYVRARGGAASAAQGSVAGRSAARGIGGFLSDVARSGIAQALRNANLAQYVGASVDDLLAGFADAFLPPPNTLDDAAAREAGLEAFNDLIEQYGALDQGLDVLDRLDADGIKHAIEHFFARYICNSALVVLSKRIEDGSISIARCEEIERTLREVIMEAVRLDFRNADVVNMDWNGREGRQLIDRLIVDAYTLVEAG